MKIAKNKKLIQGDGFIECFGFIIVIAIIYFFGFWSGYYHKESEIEEKAIKNHIAHYNQETGKFEWNTNMSVIFNNTEK
jgi:hypothetical protein